VLSRSKFNDRSSRCPKIPLEMQRVTERVAPVCQAQEKAPPKRGSHSVIKRRPVDRLGAAPTKL
jgi:hypothetical protein